MGNGSGIGGAAALRFAKAGFNVALITRSPQRIEKFATDLTSSGAQVRMLFNSSSSSSWSLRDPAIQAQTFPISAYDYSETSRVFAAVKSKWPDAAIRVTIWNAGDAVFKSFLETTEADVRATAETVLVGSFAFARESVLTFQDQQSVRSPSVI